MNHLSRIFCEATKEVVEAATAREVTYSETLQKVGQVLMRPDIGCFVLFSGDYSGLMIMNFTGGAALAIYQGSLIKMGFPEDELSHDFTADDVVNAIGETINQIIGKARRTVETYYGLTARNTQPRAIAITSSIVLTVDGHDVTDELCRRLSFKINGHAFYIEMAMEKTEFLHLDGSDAHQAAGQKVSNQVDFAGMQKKAAEQHQAQGHAHQPNIEAMMHAQVGPAAPATPVAGKAAEPAHPAAPALSQPPAPAADSGQPDIEALMALMNKGG